MKNHEIDAPVSVLRRKLMLGLPSGLNELLAHCREQLRKTDKKLTGFRLDRTSTESIPLGETRKLKLTDDQRKILGKWQLVTTGRRRTLEFTAKGEMMKE